MHKVKKIHAFVEENTGFTKKDVRWALLFFYFKEEELRLKGIR